MENSQKPSLKFRTEDSVLEHRNAKHDIAWDIPAAELVLIAEYTTNEGPYAEDYFVEFIADAGAKFNFATVSFSADGTSEALAELARHFGTGVEPLLFSTTEWASRVMWPAELRGNDYFEFRRIEPKTFKEKLRTLVLGPISDTFLSQSVQEFLRGLKREQPSGK